MFGFGMQELLIVLVLALLVFGPKSLPQIGGVLGKSIRNFKKGIGSERADDISSKEISVTKKT